MRQRKPAKRMRFRRNFRGASQKASRQGRGLRIRDLVLAIGILVLLAAVVMRLQTTSNVSLQGRAHVIDGDTMIMGGERLRLHGIDAPELDQICMKQGQKYSCGRSSRMELAHLAKGMLIECAGSERDRYGRLLVICVSGNVDLNGAMVSAGWAVSYGRYYSLERKARSEGLGLWAGEFDRPSDWRKMHGSPGSESHGVIGQFTDWLREIFYGVGVVRHDSDS